LITSGCPCAITLLRQKSPYCPERCQEYFRGLLNAIKFPRFSCLKGLGSPNALKSEYSQMQREKPASHNDPTAQPGDQLSAWNEAANSFHGDKICRPRALPSVRLLAVTAALGVALALMWRSTGILPGQFWPAAPEPAPQSASNPTTEERFSQLAQEPAALKKSISELASAQQQSIAGIAALQAGQQELRQRTSVAYSYWYSEPALRFATRPAPSVSPPRTAAGQADAQVREGQRREGSRPLQLVALRP
jgi:hypothetical protein